MKRFQRSDRVSEELQKEIAAIISREMKDPRVGSFVSIVRVEASKDIRNATVFVSVFGPEGERAGTIKALEAGAGYIRTLLGKRMRMRVIPQLIFRLDSSIEKGAEINRILNEVLPKEPVESDDDDSDDDQFGQNDGTPTND